MRKRVFFLFLLAVPVAMAVNAPVVTIETDYSGTYVYQGSSVICELRDNRFLRFRSNANNDHWIGQDKKPADIGWGYQDIKGYEHVGLTKKIEPGRFELHLVGRKEIADADQNTVIIGVWNDETQNFDYTIHSHIRADLEKWYEHSKWTKAFSPDEPMQIEPMDFHIERISTSDRFFIGDHNKEIYDCLLLSEDGSNWTRIPKLNVFRNMYKADYIASEFVVPEGGYTGFIDREEGGWLIKLKRATTGEERIEVCWYWHDLHQLIMKGVPPRSSGLETFEAEQEWEYIKVTPQQARGILDDSDEIPWRDAPEYIRPVFFRNNDFRKLIDGEKFQWCWRSSSPDCLWSDTVGYDDNQSVSIIKESADRRVDAWYAQIQWNGYYMGYPFDWKKLPPGKKVRVNAMVKTSGVVGEVRLKAIYAGYESMLYRNKEGVPAKDATGEVSDSLTGDNDWTPLSVSFTTQDPWNLISLEIEGTGKVWFDNVVIEEIE